ncbi:acyltransferase family protein [Candidatus Bipolaricaulota bacterium]
MARCQSGEEPHVDFFVQWMMPLFFVLSGASIYFALQKRSGRQFIVERLLRLMLPLVTLGSSCSDRRRSGSTG